jgi:F-type H+-transporting ATPase subunit epsilon
MADTLMVTLVTPHRRLFDGMAKSFLAPGKNGEFGILPGHDPWVVALGMGALTVTPAEGPDEAFFLNGGFCQIDEDKVEILAEIAEVATEIDVERAAAAKKRAEERIKEALQDDDVDLMRAEMALRRSLMRLGLTDK